MSEQLPPSYPMNGGYMPPQANPQPPQARKYTGVATLAAMVVLIFAILVILNETMLTIRAVEVVGSQRFKKEEVIAAAGLNHPVSYFAVDEQAIARSMSANNRYLIFERAEKTFPNQLTLFVRERQPIARVQEMGTEYVIDAEGMVLERYQQGSSDDFSGLMFITGLRPKELRVGQVLQAGTSVQAESFRALIEEVMLQGITSEISELNVSDSENLYLTTTDNFTAHLGGTDDLRAKVGTVRAVVAYLRAEGSAGGMLEASIPGEAVYSPVAP
ncbi:MAG: FtsQ-type POTRA domain-containing protein [Clostridia bacterium]|nr:FtsQ-type POTRA domain-containing protein [Clostridia bacterium]